MSDLHFQEKGAVWLVQPVTPKGEAWIIDHTSVRALRLFGAIEIERRIARNVFNDARADGLDVGSTRPDLSGFAYDCRRSAR